MSIKKETISNQQALNIYNEAQPLLLRKDLEVGFSWPLLLNLEEITKKVVEPIQKLQKPTTGFLAYDEARKAICEEAALKDTNGKPLTKNGTYVFPADYTLDLSELEALHKKDLEHRQKQNTDALKVLERPYTGTLEKADVADLPSPAKDEKGKDNGLSIMILAALRPMLKGNRE